MPQPRSDWREVILQKYRDKKLGSLGPLQVQVARPFLVLLDAAAQRVDMNRSTFIRRSVALSIASVLHLDLQEVLHFSPRQKGWGVSGGKFDPDERDTTAGVGVLCCPGCTAGHGTG